MKKKKYNKQEADKRLSEAKPWLLECTCSPVHIVRKYRKQFHLDNVTTVKDLQNFGIQFTREQLKALHASRAGNAIEENLYESDETDHSHFMSSDDLPF